jgi:hypothetical protein
MVVDGRERDAQRRHEADLLLHLADGALGHRFAGVELALGPRPVVVPWPVDQEDLQLVLLDAPRKGAGSRDGYRLARVIGLIRYG